eukprot:COSAG02_NODE_56125_length_287_cov_0.670213_1_plen_62_part_00
MCARVCLAEASVGLIGGCGRLHDDDKVGMDPAVIATIGALQCPAVLLRCSVGSAAAAALLV